MVDTSENVPTWKRIVFHFTIVATLFGAAAAGVALSTFGGGLMPLGQGETVQTTTTVSDIVVTLVATVIFTVAVRRASP